MLCNSKNRLLSAQYKALDDEDKAHWKNIATDQKARYLREMISYVPPADEMDDTIAESLKETTGLRELLNDVRVVEQDNKRKKKRKKNKKKSAENRTEENATIADIHMD